MHVCERRMVRENWMKIGFFHKECVCVCVCVRVKEEGSNLGRIFFSRNDEGT